MKDPLVEMLQRLAASAPREAPPHLGVRLDAAFRHHHSRQRRLRIARFTGLAACVLIAAIVVARHRTPSRLSRQMVATPASSPHPGLLPTPVPSTPTPAADQRIVRRLQPHVANRVAQRAFLALPGVDRRTLDGDLMIVRLRLSCADLGLIGVPVSEENPYDVVVADVLIDQDGTPYAVRVVN